MFLVPRHTIEKDTIPKQINMRPKERELIHPLVIYLGCGNYRIMWFLEMYFIRENTSLYNRLLNC